VHDGHRPILAAALLFVGVLLFLTVYVAVDTGPDVLTVVSALVLAMLGFGILGALRERE
jgi:VIT1/CCC1 family predicted Fe2+/Mn2+ transporter